MNIVNEAFKYFKGGRRGREVIEVSILLYFGVGAFEGESGGGTGHA